MKKQYRYLENFLWLSDKLYPKINTCLVLTRSFGLDTYILTDNVLFISGGPRNFFIIPAPLKFYLNHCNQSWVTKNDRSTKFAKK